MHSDMQAATSMPEVAHVLQLAAQVLALPTMNALQLWCTKNRDLMGLYGYTRFRGDARQLKAAKAHVVQQLQTGFAQRCILNVDNSNRTMAAAVAAALDPATAAGERQHLLGQQAVHHLTEVAGTTNITALKQWCQRWARTYCISGYSRYRANDLAEAKRQVAAQVVKVASLVPHDAAMPTVGRRISRSNQQDQQELLPGPTVAVAGAPPKPFAEAHIDQVLGMRNITELHKWCREFRWMYVLAGYSKFKAADLDHARLFVAKRVATSAGIPLATTPPQVTHTTPPLPGPRLISAVPGARKQQQVTGSAAMHNSRPPYAAAPPPPDADDRGSSARFTTDMSEDCPYQPAAVGSHCGLSSHRDYDPHTTVHINELWDDEEIQLEIELLELEAYALAQQRYYELRKASKHSFRQQLETIEEGGASETETDVTETAGPELQGSGAGQVAVRAISKDRACVIEAQGAATMIHEVPTPKPTSTDGRQSATKTALIPPTPATHKYKTLDEATPSTPTRHVAGSTTGSKPGAATDGTARRLFQELDEPDEGEEVVHSFFKVDLEEHSAPQQRAAQSIMSDTDAGAHVYVSPHDGKEDPTRLPTRPRKAPWGLKALPQALQSRMERSSFFRKNVTRFEADVWAERGGVDAYTGMSRQQIRRQYGQFVEVDHVVECQLAPVPWVLAVQEHGHHKFEFPGGRSELRVAAAPIVRIWNSKHNLNVTTQTVNRAKKGPFTRFVNAYKDGVSLPLYPECFRNMAVKHGSEVARHICASVERAAMEILSSLDDAAASGKQYAGLIGTFTEEFAEMVANMGLEDACLDAAEVGP